MRKLQVNVGDKYNRLTVLALNQTVNNRPAVLVRCDCGKEFFVRISKLLSGHTKSCGCWRADIRKDLSTTHGLRYSPLYYIWMSMRQRCNNPNNSSYKNYGARGIKVCPEWNEFMVFYFWAMSNGYEKGLSIERINNDGDYSSANCCFASRKSQASNRRDRVSKHANGVRVNLGRLARQHGLLPATLYSRLHLGWSLEEALTREVRNSCV